MFFYLHTLFLSVLLLWGCDSQSIEMEPKNNTKICGVSFVSSNSALTKSDVLPVKNINSNFVALIPFGFIEDLDSPNVYFDSEKQWFGETKEGIKQYVSTFKTEDLKIMIKPQIWVWQGKFTGDIDMDSEEKWLTLEQSYSKFILEFAALAQELNIEMFCIGTELEQFVIQRPLFWNDLINHVKKVYQGKLTYAANWNEFEKVPFWKHLDYIGIDAYFPLSDKKTPTVEDCKHGWVPHKDQIKNIYSQIKIPILFTEYGYRSVDYTAQKPWSSEHLSGNINLIAQINATQAIFDEFWEEAWFAGGFIWKWHTNHTNAGGTSNNRFTAQNKPAEDLIKNQYLSYSK